MQRENESTWCVPVDATPQLARLLERGETNDLARRFAEDGVVKLVGTFQRFAEAVCMGLPGVVPARPNVFQTISEASELWRGAIGIGYADLLTIEELRSLNRFVQQRHLLSHRDGLVDREYIDRSGDQTNRVGHRIVVRADDARALAELVSVLARRLHEAVRAHVGGTPWRGTFPGRTHARRSSAQPILAANRCRPAVNPRTLRAVGARGC